MADKEKPLILSRKFMLRNFPNSSWLILLLLCLLSYAGGLTGDFVFDDNPLIANDKFYSSETSPAECWERGFWQDGRGGLYRPLTVFSYWLNSKISGLDSHAFRAVNLSLHFIATLLVWFVARRLCLGKTCAMLAAMLFAVHPLHSEAIIPAFGRSELLCAIFLMLAFLFHMEKASWRSSMLSGAFFLLALWSKEHAAAFLPLCLIYDALWGRFRNKWQICRYSSYVVFAVLFLISKHHAMHSLVPSKDMQEAIVDNRLALCPPQERIVSAIRIQGISLWKFIWPETLSHDYSYAQILPSESIFDIGAIIVMSAFVAVSLLLIRTYPKRRRQILFIILAYAVCVIPAGNFIIPAGTIYAERLTYIPSVWLCLSASLAVMAISRRLQYKSALILISGIIIALSIRTVLRCNDWHDRTSIALAGVKTAPKSVKTWKNLAVQFEERGQFEEAINTCNMAISIFPDDSSAYLNRGTYHARLSMDNEAEIDFRKALSLNPKNGQAAMNLAIILANTGRASEAKEILKHLLEQSPSNKSISRMLIELDKKQHP